MAWILPHKPNDLHLVLWNALLIQRALLGNIGVLYGERVKAEEYV
jgi:hypothetical protein